MLRAALLLAALSAASASADAPETPPPRPEESAPPPAPVALPPPAPEPPSPGPASLEPALVEPPAAPPPGPTAPPAPARRLPFAPAESMEFTVHYLGIKMGTARIWVGEPESEVLPLHLLARTGGIAALFDVRQELVSRLDTATGLPVTSLLDAVEGSYRHTDTTVFDRPAGKATVTVKGKYLTVKEVEVPPGAIDFVALVFRLRQLPLEPGASHEFDVLAGNKVSRVVARVLGREVLRTRAGTFPTVKVQVPTGFTGKFSEKDPTQIWLSDDPRRVVVRLSTDFAIGRAVASLTAYGAGRAAD